MGLLAAIGICVVGVFTIALLDTSSDGNYGLPRQKVIELAKYGITPQQYANAQKRAEAHKAALLKAPPSDPNVAGPNLIKEEHEPELIAWKAYYAHRLHARVREQWHINQLAENHTIATLHLVTETSPRPLVTAEWIIRFALDRPPTPAEEKIFHSSKGVEALNVAAHRLETFPKPRFGLSLPTGLLAVETLSPGQHEVIVKIEPADRYEPTFIVRNGIVDESLLRGRALTKSPPTGNLTLGLATMAKVYEQALGAGQAGPKRRSSIYKLNHAFNEGPVLLVLGWHSSTRDLRHLLRRPVQELTILR